MIDSFTLRVVELEAQVALLEFILFIKENVRGHIAALGLIQKRDSPLRLFKVKSELQSGYALSVREHTVDVRKLLGHLFLGDHLSRRRVKYLSPTDMIAMKMGVDDVAHRQGAYRSELIERGTSRGHALGRVNHHYTRMSSGGCELSVASARSELIE